MSLLGRLLQAKDPMFTLALKQLEDVTNRKGLDTRLIGDIYASAQQRLRLLKLDPADTTGLELYNSLINLVKEHNQHLAHVLGGKDPDNVSQMLPLIVAQFAKLDIPRSGWFLKETVAKKFLRQMPPAKIMNRLGHENVENLLEKENVHEIYGAMRFGEEPQWLNDFIGQYHKLTFKDFEHREIKIINYAPEKWGDLAAEFVKKKLHNITHLKELGTLCMLPHAKHTERGFTLVETAFLFHYLYEVRLYSSYFKLISVKKGFGKAFAQTLIADTAHVPIMDGRHNVHWRVIQRYFGKLADEKHPELFEPHVQPEDLHWRKAEEVLYQIDPELEFWNDMDYVSLILGGEVVTFNLMDIALSYAQGLPYAKRYLYHFREALWNEVFIRYLGERVLEREVLERLDNELIAPERVISVSKQK